MTIKMVGFARNMRIPVWEKESRIPGKTIVVTAGMDGDEYAGIEAAYELIKLYSNSEIVGKLIIIPLVNMPGFTMSVSLNPLDVKYPKYIYPGKKNGSDTEKLLYFLSDRYISKADVWIDLHDGSLVENLKPFVWAWQTGNKDLDEITKNIVSRMKAGVKVFDTGKWNKVQSLAKENIAYILLESGQRGERNKTHIVRHVNWVKNIIKNVNGRENKYKQANVYTRVDYVYATEDGFWYPNTKLGEIKKGDELGSTVSLIGKQIKTLKSSRDGIVLWYRTSLSSRKGEILVAVAGQ